MVSVAVRTGRAVGVALAGFLLACGAACVVDGPAADRSVVRSGGPMPDAVPAILEAQSLRVRRLPVLESRGVIEFRWRDADGAHFEQCDLDLFAILPDRFALRASKIGERFLWLGGDANRWWVFFLNGKPTRLEVYPFDRPFDRPVGGPVGGGAGENAVTLSPREILTLAGLVPLPPADSPLVRGATGSDGVTVIEVAAHDAIPRSRWGFTAGTLTPAAIELLAADGTVVARSVLTSYVSVPADGLAVGAWPRVPSRIELSASDAARGEAIGTATSGSLRITLDAPSARGERIRDRLFDLEELQRSLRPDTVVRFEPIGSGATGP